MNSIDRWVRRNLMALLCTGFLLLSTMPAWADAIEPGVPDAANLFKPALLKLQMTGIPLRIPTYIPSGGQRLKTPKTEANARRLRVYAVVDQATPNGYDVILGYSPTCSGGNACRLGTVTATRKTAGTPAIEDDYAFMKDPTFKGLRSKQPMSKVQLSNQITGVFVPWICGANCNDAKVVWDENDVRYSVGIKVGDRESLVTMANSAIVRRN